MKRIRRVLGRRRRSMPPSIKPEIIYKEKKNRKRYRWNAILDRLPNDVPLIGAEIGVLNGNTAYRILGARPLLIHYMVDPWTAPEKDSSYYLTGDSNSLKPAREHEIAYKRTLKRVEFAGDRAIILRMYSVEAEKIIKDNSLDFVFIDGDHSYAGVKKDIKLWLPKVKKGGWIGGHDYNHSRLPGVKKAVDEVFNNLELDDNRTWFVRL